MTKKNGFLKELKFPSLGLVLRTEVGHTAV